MSRKDARNLEKLRKYSERLDGMLSDGSFDAMPAAGRRKLVGRIRRLAASLLGVVPERTLRHVMAGAAVVALGVAGCAESDNDRDTSTDPMAEMDADAVDSTEIADGLDTLDVPDTTADPDVTDVPDTMTDPDVMDVPDTMTDPDVMDVPDTWDAPDWPDGPDIVDVPDTWDAPDVPDTTDAVDMEWDAVTGITFGAAQSNPFGLVAPGGYYGMPAAADLDGDGDVDLLVSTYDYYSPGWRYYENTGTASAPAFGAATVDPFGLTWNATMANPVLADLDGDGDFDLLSSEMDSYTYYGVFRYYENTGTASAPAFAAASDDPFGLDPSVLYWTNPIEVLDLDGNNIQDLLVGDWYGDMHHYPNTGSATAPAFGAYTTNPYGLTPTYWLSAPAAADIDDDGDLDLFVGEYYGVIQFFQNAGSSSAPAFVPPTANPFGITSVSMYAYPEFADMDDDGDLDLWVGEYGGNLVYFENTTT